MFFGLCLSICAHFDIARISLGNFDGDKKKFVQNHQTILDLAEGLNQLFKPIVFVEFAMISMLLCVCGFQVVMTESFFGKMISLGFGSFSVFQLFSYSFGGQLISERSSAVADHLYTIDRDSLIIIARSRKPVLIEAGFYQADLPTFRIFLSSAASLITLLHSIFVK